MGFESILSLKSQLLMWKRKGVIFIQEQIFELEMHQELSLYWALAKGNSKTQKPNAFPVPKEALWKVRQIQDHNNLLTYYFSTYYKLEDFSFQLSQEYYRFYIVDEFIWFYQ